MLKKNDVVGRVRWQGGRAVLCMITLSALVPISPAAEKTAAEAPVKTAEQKEADRRRLEEQERIERIVRTSHQQFEMQKTRLIQSNLTYARAQDDYDKAKQHKHEVPAFIHAAIGFAVAWHDVRDYVRASELYNEAVDAYLTLNKDAPPEMECRRDILSHLGYLAPALFQSKFIPLFKVIEQRTSASNLPELNKALLKIASDQISNHHGARTNNFGEAGEPFDDKQFWRNLVEIRSSARGDNDPSLQPLLERYVVALEQHNELTEAEQVFVRLSKLNNTRSDDSEVKTQLDLAKFYMRHSMLDKSEAAYQKAETLSHGKMTRAVVTQFMSLASDFKSRSRPDIADKILEGMLASGGDETIREIDGVLNTIITGYLNSFELTRAQALLSKRVEAAKTCSNDHQANHWRLKLSDVDLALGQETESNKLFEQVKITTALTNGNVDKLVEDRKKLLESLKLNKQSSSPPQSSKSTQRK